MFKCKFLAASLICAAGMVATANSESLRLDCSTGELTLGRIADGECVSRIPLPTARPGAFNADASKTVAADPIKKWEFIETPGAAQGETRMVRMVGSRFLPDANERIDFRAHASSQAGLFDAAVNSAAAYIGLAASKPQPAVEAVETQAAVVQEARVDFGSLALRN